MKKIIQRHELYGEVMFKNERWRKVELISGIFNMKEIQIPLDIDILDVSYIEYKLGIGYLGAEFFTEDDIKGVIEYDQQLEDRYNQYIVNFQETIQLIEDVIVQDYYEYREEFPDEEIINYNNDTVAKKLLRADTPQKILNLVKLKRIIVYNNRVIIEVRCPWYPASEAGISLKKEGYISMGSGEMKQ